MQQAIQRKQTGFLLFANNSWTYTQYSITIYFRTSKYEVLQQCKDQHHIKVKIKPLKYADNQQAEITRGFAYLLLLDIPRRDGKKQCKY